MPTTNSTVIFKAGLEAAYKSITTKDLNTVYFVTDTQRLFVGETEYTRPVQHGTSLPTEFVPPNSLFVLETGNVRDLYYSKDGASWEQIAHLPAELAVGMYGVARGSATKVPQITVDKFGNVTHLAEVDIAFPEESSITVNGNSDTGNVITGITAEGHTVTVTKGSMATSAELTAHTNNKANPHNVTTSQIKAMNEFATFTEGDESKIVIASNQNTVIVSDKKVSDLATASALGDVVNRVSIAEGEIDTLQALPATGISSDDIKAWNDEIGAKELAASKVASVSGKDAISVTTGTTPEVSLKLDPSGNVQLSQTATGLKAQVTIPAANVTGVKSGDKVLALDGTELTSTLNLTYDSTAGEDGKKYIRLKGIGGADIATIDASEFIKDGMVSNVTFEPTTKILTITFNTDAGKEEVDVDLASLVDTYTAGDGIDITGNVVSIDLDENCEDFLTIDETSKGLKLAGVQNAIDAAKSAVMGTAADTADKNTVYGAKAAAAAAQAAAEAAQDTADKAVVANTDLEDGKYGTYTKITFDKKGLVTKGESLIASDIPELNASKITSGQFKDERIESVSLTKVTGAGTAAEKNVLTGAIKDNKTTEDVVTAQQVAAFVDSQALKWGSF